jgi:hypothetical protein
MLYFFVKEGTSINEKDIIYLISNHSHFQRLLRGGTSRQRGEYHPAFSMLSFRSPTNSPKIRICTAL